ncbi:MAG: hypothetical protein LBP23_08415 [Treponema sp.]|nr:hypothetical protein [Treponema sp.]
MSYADSRFVFNDGLDTDERATWNPSVIAGFSFLNFLNKSLFFDIGLDSKVWFNTPRLAAAQRSQRLQKFGIKPENPLTGSRGRV